MILGHLSVLCSSWKELSYFWRCRNWRCLEPLQAGPVIIEDNCFIGARSEIAEGVLVEEGAVLSMGVYIGASTKIIDRNSGEIYYGKVPAYSVVVPGSLPNKSNPNGPSCIVQL